VDAFLDYWDILVFVEGVIYQDDELNEYYASTGEVNSSPKSLEVVRQILQRLGLLTPVLELELNEGEQYWAQERSIAACLYRNPVALPEGHSIGFTLEEVHSCSARKSFDYRVSVTQCVLVLPAASGSYAETFGQ